MVTYQDLMAVGEDEKERTAFVYSTINRYVSSDFYHKAKIADDYDARKNTTIMAYQKLLYEVTGRVVPDNYSASFKLCSGFFPRFVMQENQYLLGNGVSWMNPQTSDKLGKDFDTKLQNAGHKALIHGVSYGFWNLDHLDVFDALEFIPLYDEENGSLSAGIRFWQIDNNKPLRATLYELDGYTEYIRKDSDPEIIRDKQSYKLLVRSTPADGVTIYDGENYPTFPIVPLYGNKRRQSELIGIREQIDAYDLIKSGFANDLDDASMIYWIIQNGGGMDEVDLAKFVDRIKTVGAAVVEDGGAHAEAHTIEPPYNSREALLERLRSDLYDDFMALDTKVIAGGATTATQIKAAYEPLNNKVDGYEYCVIEFLSKILELAGIDDEPSFTRSKIVNMQEEAQVVLSAASYLSEEYVTQKVLEVLGDGDKAEDMLKQMDADELSTAEEQRELIEAMRQEQEAVKNGRGTQGNGQADIES